MTDRPLTDVHELVKREVCAHIKPFVEATMMEHEATRKKIQDLEHTVRSMGSLNFHDVIQYVAIGIIIVSMLILHG